MDFNQGHFPFTREKNAEVFILKLASLVKAGNNFMVKAQREGPLEEIGIVPWNMGSYRDLKAGCLNDKVKMILMAASWTDKRTPVGIWFKGGGYWVVEIQDDQGLRKVLAVWVAKGNQVLEMQPGHIKSRIVKDEAKIINLNNKKDSHSVHSNTGIGKRGRFWGKIKHSILSHVKFYSIAELPQGSVRKTSWNFSMNR